MGSLQTFEANFRQPRKNKGVALNTIKENTSEADQSDSEMGIEEMALFVKKFKKFFNKRQRDQPSSFDKIKGKPLDKVKFVRKPSDKS